MKNKPKISVIIPTKGREKLLKNCLYSLSSQSILPDEVIVVDNSRNKLIQTLLKTMSIPNIKIKYVREPKKGVAYARNTGIKNAKNNLLAFIDDDCTAGKNWIKNIIHFYKQVGKTVVVQGKSLNGFSNNLFACVEHFITEKFFLGRGVYKNYKNHLIANSLITRNCVIHKSFFLNYSYFDTKFSHYYEDIDFGQRIRMKGISILYNPKIYVIHYGKTDIINHLKGEFYRGQDAFKFKKKWQKAINRNSKKSILILEKYLNKNKKTVEKKLKKKFLEKKNILFRLNFEILLFFDIFLYWVGYYYASFFTWGKEKRKDFIQNFALIKYRTSLIYL